MGLFVFKDFMIQMSSYATTWYLPFRSPLMLICHVFLNGTTFDYSLPMFYFPFLLLFPLLISHLTEQEFSRNEAKN